MYYDNPDKLAKVLKKSIRDSYRLGKVAQNSIDINLGVQMRVIRALEKEIKVSTVGEILSAEEFNTMPGFTKISMYPKLFETVRITYTELLDKLIKNTK